MSSHGVETTPSYVAMPFDPRPERAGVVSQIMRELMRYDNIFTDWQRACGERCGDCEECVRCRSVIAFALAHADSRSWEVWKEDGDVVELVGVVMLTKVLPGVDAEAHYVFFDGKLNDKTDLLQELIDWVFEDHDDWVALRRITVAIPDFAFSLARHAHRYLGFGGDFMYEKDGKSVQIEGVRRSAFRWRGMDRDQLLMGRVR